MSSLIYICESSYLEQSKCKKSQVKELKPLQNKKGPKNLGYPRKKQSFYNEKDCFLHKFAYFVHALRLFKALHLFFLTDFPGPMVIPCSTSIPDSRVHKLITVI